MDTPSAKTRLSRYDNSAYDPGAPYWKRALWHMAQAWLLSSAWLPSSAIRVWLLRRFGARIGRGVVIRPRVRVKQPWRLRMGDHVWIGESVWIDNLTEVRLGDNVCLSQGAMLLTGNHDYKKPAFDLITGEIHLEAGVWIGARATVCPGVTARSHAVLAVGSVAVSDLEAYAIYQGNPAAFIRKRVMHR